ncbi:hypothetical protein [Virgibacillus litoralis]|uniref:XRE family transcriptional regulator n=1 Tax=Virgibacillus litoralis TaxID=578221 RepID=A0ABS4HBC7_9BACI|nr:hypothetical protein [Virgibacillus litoralis]
MLDEKFFLEMQKYVEDHIDITPVDVCESSEKVDYSIHKEIEIVELEDFIEDNRKPTLKEVLFNLIDEKDTSDAYIYKKAGIDRRHFSKIRSNPEYQVGKNTVIALALALELNKEKTDKLLSSAGYSLSESDTYDLVIQFCIEKKVFNIYDVNQALDYFSLKPLTGLHS